MLMSLFFFNDTATPEIYPLSLHDALPIFVNALDPVAPDGNVAIPSHPDRPARGARRPAAARDPGAAWRCRRCRDRARDRKSTRLNSSHANISYAVFCLKKKILLYIITIKS